MSKVISLFARDSSAWYFQLFYTLKTFFDVFVDFSRISTISKKFKEIIICKEVESWKSSSFGLKQAI